MGRKRVIDDNKLLIMLGQGRTHEECADFFKCTRSAVTRAVKRLEEEDPTLFKETSVRQFREDEPDHLASARMYIMNAVLPALQALKSNNLTPEMIRKLLLSADKMLTMEKLIRGEPTSHQAIGVLHQIDHKQMEELKKIATTMNKQIVDNSVPLIEWNEEGEIIDVSDE